MQPRAVAAGRMLDVCHTRANVARGLLRLIVLFVVMTPGDQRLASKTAAHCEAAVEFAEAALGAARLSRDCLSFCCGQGDDRLAGEPGRVASVRDNDPALLDLLVLAA